MSECKCKTCKNLFGCLCPNDTKDGISTKYLCKANNKCIVEITYLLDKSLGECIDYVSYDSNMTDNYELKNVPIEKYEYNLQANEIDCTRCSYFYTTPMLSPGGYCQLKNNSETISKERICGLGNYCEKFTTENKKMKNNIKAQFSDIQKICLQLNEK